MENDFIKNQFEEIEQKVVKLIASCNKYKAMNQDLEKRIQDLKKGSQDKDSAISGYLEERNVIGSKVKSILQKLNDMSEDSEQSEK